MEVDNSLSTCQHEECACSIEPGNEFSAPFVATLRVMAERSTKKCRARAGAATPSAIRRDV